MKKAILILLLLQSLSAAAQIRISDFKQLYSDGSAAEAGTALSDPDGRCGEVPGKQPSRPVRLIRPARDGYIILRCVPLIKSNDGLR